MRIKAITKHVFKGKEYNSLSEIKDEIQNTIGLEVLDKIARKCPLGKHKDYQVLMDLLCSKEVRDVLIECLSVTFDKEPEEWDESEEYKTINILDI